MHPFLRLSSVTLLLLAAGCGGSQFPTSPTSAVVPQSVPPAPGPPPTGVIEAQGLRISKFSVSVPAQLVQLELTETSGKGGIWVRGITYELVTGDTDSMCPWKDVRINPSETWSLSSLGYCAPYPWPFPVSIVTVHVRFEDSSGEAGHLYATLEAIH